MRFHMFIVTMEPGGCISCLFYDQLESFLLYLSYSRIAGNLETIPHSYSTRRDTPSDSL